MYVAITNICGNHIQVVGMYKEKIFPGSVNISLYKVVTIITGSYHITPYKQLCLTSEVKLQVKSNVDWYKYIFGWSLGVYIQWIECLKIIYLVHFSDYCILSEVVYILLIRFDGFPEISWKFESIVLFDGIYLSMVIKNLVHHK